MKGVARAAFDTLQDTNIRSRYRRTPTAFKNGRKRELPNGAETPRHKLLPLDLWTPVRPHAVIIPVIKLL